MYTENITINFLGDSITQGVGVSSEDKIYHALLSVKEARNYGISGTRIARQDDGDAKYMEDFCRRAERMEDADAVVVFGGTNDFGHGTAPMGKFTDRDNYTYYGALHCLMQCLLKKYSGKPIVFMTPLHRQVEEGVSPDGTKRTLYDYICAMKEVARYYAIPVLDLYSTSMIQPQEEFSRNAFCPDGLHPNDAGHRLIADRLKGFLQSL